MAHTIKYFNQKAALELKQKLESIIERHNTYKQVNLSSSHFEGIRTFKTTTSFEYNGIAYTIVQEVNELNGDYKYAIGYYENGNHRNRNIRYLTKMYDTVKFYTLV